VLSVNPGIGEDEVPLDSPDEYAYEEMSVEISCGGLLK
jgi:hypothetical protein